VAAAQRFLACQLSLLHPSSPLLFSQVWDDVRSTVTIITTDADGLRIGPVGTTAK